MRYAQEDVATLARSLCAQDSLFVLWRNTGRESKGRTRRGPTRHEIAPLRLFPLPSGRNPLK